MDILNSIKIRAKYNRTKNISTDYRKFSSEKGETVFEEELSVLLKSIFSEYYVFINPYKSKGEELCDALIIFGNKILIFSDKGSNNFEKSINLEKAWKNFYDSTKKSEKQLLNAKDWILNNINNETIKFSINKEFTQHISINIQNDHQIFLISTLSGLNNAAAEYHNNDGVLPIDHSKKQNNKKIFSSINKQENDDFFHCFDSLSLNILAQYLDTPNDFINYLIYRQNLFINEQDFILKREDQILFLYALKDSGVLDKDSNIENIDFLQNHENLFSQLYDFSFFQDRLKYGISSKIIDDLFINFAYEGHERNSGLDVEISNDTQYRQNMLSFFNLNRRERIAFFLDLSDSIENSPNNKSELSQRLFGNYLFLICPFLKKLSESEQEYRVRRRNSALKCLEQFKNKNEAYRKHNLIILFLDHPSSISTNSEDLYFYNND